MEALSVLDLRSEKVALLPSSFPCLVNLKALFLSRSRLVNFDVTSLSLIGKMKKLEILQLAGFKFGTVPKEFGNLTSLRCLDLLDCTGTIPPNLISRLYRLEQLYLTDVFSNWQIDDGSSGDTAGCATFAELASLSCLTTLHVDIGNPDIFLQQDLNFVPWQALTDFQIFLGVKASICPMSFLPGRSRSKQLVITKSTCHLVIDLVTKTERVCLHNWSGMECLISGAEEEGFTVGHKLYQVKELGLLSMPDMKSLCTGTLPNDVDLLRKLSALVIRDCHKLIDALPTCMLLRTHQLMESLEIRRCDKLEKVLSLNFVQEEEGQSAAGMVLLPRLESIFLAELPELRSVWDDGVIMLPGSLQNLESLFVARCKSMKDILPPILPIPNKLVNFPSLGRLDIWGCDSLTYLLSWRQAKGLPHLQRLDVGNCPRMETVIKEEEEVGGATDDDHKEEEEEESHVLASLTDLYLVNLPMLRSFQGEQCSKSLSSFKSLKKLQVVECPKLKKLPPSSSSVLESHWGESWESFEKRLLGVAQALRGLADDM